MICQLVSFIKIQAAFFCCKFVKLLVFITDPDAAVIYHKRYRLGGMGPYRYGSIMVGEYHHPVRGALFVNSLFYGPYDLPVNYLNGSNLIFYISMMTAFIRSFQV